MVDTTINKTMLAQNGASKVVQKCVMVTGAGNGSLSVYGLPACTEHTNPIYGKQHRLILRLHATGNSILQLKESESSVLLFHIWLATLVLTAQARSGTGQRTKL